MLKLDKNRQLQLALAMAPVLDRMAARQDVFVEIDVFRNTKSENKIARKSLIGWLRRSGLIEDKPDGYLVKDVAGLQSLASRMKGSPFLAMGQYLLFCNKDRGEETAEAPALPEAEETAEEETAEEETKVDDEDDEGQAPQDQDEDPPDEGMSEEYLPLKVSIEETLRELDKMTSEATTKNRARYVLSIAALAILLSKVPDGGFLTRKDLFKTPNIVHEKCVTNESLAKAWQKTFLDRTEEMGLTEKTISGRDSVYRIADGKTNDFIHMVSDAVHEGGRALRHILWPGQYGPEDEEADDAAPEQEAPEEGQGAIEVLSELVGQLTAVAESMGQVQRSMESVLSGLSEISEQGRAREERAETFLSGIQKSLSSIVSRLDSEERGALSSIKDRLTEIQVRRRSLSNQLESEAQREEKLLEELRTAVSQKGDQAK